MARLLFISGSLGLGHVKRDLAIARALRSELAGVVIEWLAGEPARSVLKGAGEPLHPRCEAYQSDTEPAEAAASGGAMNILRYLLRARRAWATNARLFGEIVQAERFDGVVADEAYEVTVGHRAGIRVARVDATPDRLAEVIAENIGAEVGFAEIDADGARRAAALIAESLSRAPCGRGTSARPDGSLRSFTGESS